MACDVKGCEGQTTHRGEKEQELRRFPISRAEYSGAEIVCRQCHMGIMRHRKDTGGLVLTWVQGTVYTGC